MSAHTPGKWSVEHTSGFVRTVCVTSDFLDSDRKTLACFGPVDNPWAQANARIFAAAPDLLAAAKNALTRLDREDAEKRAAGMPAAHDSVVGSVNDQLRAAIAKAEVRS